MSVSYIAAAALVRCILARVCAIPLRCSGHYWPQPQQCTGHCNSPRKTFPFKRHSFDIRRSKIKVVSWHMVSHKCAITGRDNWPRYYLGQLLHIYGRTIFQLPQDHVSDLFMMPTNFIQLLSTWPSDSSSSHKTPERACKTPKCSLWTSQQTIYARKGGLCVMLIICFEFEFFWLIKHVLMFPGHMDYGGTLRIALRLSIWLSLHT